ncbi:hypothetical protein JW935_23300, partial [candidate division KSB1 bacterium]|nr:hypothetical protein [candidate division KSB1 bacterium]
MKSHFIHDNFKLAVFLLISHRLLAAQFCTPGWLGETLIDCQITAGWTVEHDNGSSGNLITTAGVDGGAVQLQWNLGSGSWVQARYLFSPAIDLSGNDIFGLSLHGQAGTSNRVSLMFADTHGVFYGIDCDGLNVIDRWMVNLSFPKKMFYHFFTISAGPPGLTDIDWRSIDRFFVVVKRPGNSDGGGNGRLGIDLLQADRAADWPRPRSFEAVTGNETAKMAALEYIQNSQTETGLLVSWKEEPVKKSYLYDQALALIALCREGTWQNGVAADEFAKTAEKLVGFIQSTQKHDGSWPRAWNSKTGENLVDDSWIGDQAWWVMALCIYARKSGDDVTMAAAQRGAEWLVQHVNNDGTVVPSTEGTVDTWWALVAAERFAYADKIQQALLTKHRDDELGYWYRGFAGNPDPVIAMDAATWMSAFARSSRVNLPQMGLEALGFVQRTLVTA